MNNAPLDSLIARRDALEGILSRIDVWLLVFGIFVVIGVAGESVFGIRAWWNNRKLHSVQESIDEARQAETSRFNKQAADANREAGLAQKAAGEAIERAGKADERAANAEKEAARLNKEAEAERLARLQLEEKYAPRRLSSDQKKNIKEFLSKLRPEQVTVQVFIGTPDGIPFSMDLIEAINSSGWTATHAGQSAIGGQLRGVSILIKDATKAPQKAAIIQQALKNIGIEAPGVNDPTAEPDAVVIFISPKL